MEQKEIVNKKTANIMKKYLLLFVFFWMWDMIAYSQPTPWGGRNSTMEVLGGLQVDSAFRLPIWDTSKKFTGKGVSSTFGVIVINSRDSNVCVLKNGDWVELGSGSGTSGVNSVTVNDANGFKAINLGTSTDPAFSLSLSGIPAGSILKAATAVPFTQIVPAVPGVDVLGRVVVTLSSSDILNLSSSPKLLVPSPGAGTFIKVLYVTADYTFVSSPYVGTGSLSFREGGTEVFQGNASAYTSVSSIILDLNPFSSTGSNVATPKTLHEGDLTVGLPSNPSGGDGTLKLSIGYIIVNR